MNPDWLDRYFTRIGYAGPREPSLDVLRGMIAAHAATIPFESLDVLLGRGVRLDRDSIVAKLVHRRRGGYCFEHNTLLKDALDALGFGVEGLGARVLWRQPEDFVGPRSHMLLRVALPEGDYLADVGFGGVTLTAPIVIGVDMVQDTPHEPHRLVAAGDELELQALLGGEWTRLYRFGLQPQAPVDYEVANWFTSTFPQSLFRDHLLAARTEPDKRHGLFDAEYTVRHRDGRVERRSLRNAEELAAVLTGPFGIELPDIDDVRAAAARLGLPG